MKDEIKVGDYVRTKSGSIDKVINNEYYMPQYIECEHALIRIETIVNNSSNITDVIEVGDYVNGQYVVEKFYDHVNEEWNIVIATTQHLKIRKNRNDIKSIVTHEQFKNVEYII